MTLLEQTAIVLHAGQWGFMQPPDVQRWAKSVIEATTPGAPSWIIELVTEPIRFMDDIFATLKAHSGPLSLRRRLQIIILRHTTNPRPLRDTLPVLFRIAFLEEGGPDEPGDDSILDALAEWNLQPDLDAIPPHLASKFQSIFAEYLMDASDVAALLYPANRTCSEQF